MKSLLKKSLVAILLAISFGVLITPAEAYIVYYRNHHGYYYRTGYYHYNNCRWVNGHWQGGAYRPAHRVCWYR